MKNPVSKLTIICTTALVLVFASCKKDNENSSPDVVAAQDNISVLAQSDEDVTLSEGIMDENYSSMQRTGTGLRTDTLITTSSYACGATVTVIPKSQNGGELGKITIDFGASPGKSCTDGKTRQGKVIITYTGLRTDASSTQVITFDGYYVNGNKVEGTKTLTHSIQSANVYRTIVTVVGAKVTFTDATSVSWVSTRTRDFDTKGTKTLTDDDLTVNGTIDGVSHDGRAYSASITNLLYSAVCILTSGSVPISGTISLTPAGGVVRTIDYGTGTCDRAVTIKIGDKIINYTIK